MLESKEDKGGDFILLIEERESFLVRLTSLTELLKNSGNNAQSDFVHKLTGLINKSNLGEFVKLINGVGMWGGAGAVWEVYIENEIEAMKFVREILMLINLMERTKIIGSGIKPIRKIFEQLEENTSK